MKIGIEKISELPPEAGVCRFYGRGKSLLFTGIAADLRRRAGQLLKTDPALRKETRSIETSPAEGDLIRTHCRTIRQNGPAYNLPVAANPRYPLLKITAEKFPKMLATRKVLDEKDQYFGAFLPAAGVRVWLTALSRIFRLRNCAIEIDGRFARPCSLYFSKKCAAPCVRELCSIREYADRVEALRLFLSGDERRFADFAADRIRRFADALDYEAAAGWRDLLFAGKKLYAGKRTNLWLTDAVDTYYVDETDSGNPKIYLLTTRGRKTLGGKEFVFSDRPGLSAKFMLSEIMWQFYEFHAPREIRVTTDFPDRRFLAEMLGDIYGRRIGITVIGDRLNPTTRRKIDRLRHESTLARLGAEKPAEQLQRELQKTFGLRRPPERIEAFDVAHISNEDFVAASAVWETGRFAAEESRFWLTEEETEPRALARAVGERLVQKPFPDLLLLDGGPAQLGAVREIIERQNLPVPAVIAAVKPPGRHAGISHFLAGGGKKRVDFEKQSQMFELLRKLRDQAHETANRIHRQQRADKRLFENERIFAGLAARERRRLIREFGSVKGVIAAAVTDVEALIGSRKARRLRENIRSGKREAGAGLPLVPVYFAEPGGAADDLRPLRADGFE